MTQIQQSQEERAAICEQWGQHHIGLLAQTHHNWQLLRAALEKCPIISVVLIVKIVDHLRPQLEFLAAPAKAPAKRPNDRWNFLASIGVLKDGHESHSEKLDAQKAKAVVYQKIRDDAATMRQRQDLKRRLSEAESVFIAVKSGPHAGKCNHSATADAHARLMVGLQPELERWNREHPNNVISF